MHARKQKQGRLPWRPAAGDTGPAAPPSTSTASAFRPQQPARTLSGRGSSRVKGNGDGLRRLASIRSLRKSTGPDIPQGRSCLVVRDPRCI
jgi:hypothetical protein